MENLHDIVFGMVQKGLVECYVVCTSMVHTSIVGNVYKMFDS